VIEMWKFRNEEDVVYVKSRITKLAIEDGKRALVEIRRYKAEVDRVLKVLDSLLSDIAKLDRGLWLEIKDAKDYALDLKEFLDKYEKELSG